MKPQKKQSADASSPLKSSFYKRGSEEEGFKSDIHSSEAEQHNTIN